MNKKAVRYYLGYMLLIEMALMIPSLIISLCLHEYSASHGFGVSCLLLLSLSLPCIFIGQKNSLHSLQSREGFITVGLSWIFLSLLGAMPYWISREIPSYIDAVFETVSGLSTTGASILNDVESLCKSLLFWRSFTNWIGGMGVLVFVLTIIPQAKGQGDSLFLLRAESPGPSVGKITPTIRKTARTLYIIYIAMTALLIGALLISGMSLFDSFCNAMAAAGTGGFSVSNSGMNIYTSVQQTILAIGMILFGINFSLYALIPSGQWKRALQDEEIRLYLGIILGSVLFITADTVKVFSAIPDTAHHVFFTVSSIITTTGFSTVDYTLWPSASRWVLVTLMLLGACAGSTGGGIKISRFLIMLKSLKNEIASMLRPRSVHVVTINKKRVDDKTCRSVSIFFLSYLFIAIISSFAISVDNADGVTTVTAVISCLSNIGPGMGLVGPSGNFSFFSDWSKVILALDMLFGRLEIFPMLLLFSARAWKKG